MFLVIHPNFIDRAIVGSKSETCASMDLDNLQDTGATVSLHVLDLPLGA